jgi:hypothetical protein
MVNGIIHKTFVDAACEYGFILDQQHETQTAISLVLALRRPPGDLRFIFTLGVESGASHQMLFD